VWNAHNTVLGSKRLCHLTQCHLRWGLPPYQVALWRIQPFGHNRHRPKFRGLLCPLWGSGVPIQHNVVWADTYLHSLYQMACWSFQLFDDNRHGPKSGGCCSLVTCLNYTVKIWTVITNHNTNRNRSPNPVLTVHISTIQISPGNFTVQNLIVQISYGYPCMLGSVNTSGTGHIIPVTACREPDVQ